MSSCRITSVRIGSNFSVIGLPAVLAAPRYLAESARCSKLPLASRPLNKEQNRTDRVTSCEVARSEHHIGGYAERSRFGQSSRFMLMGWRMLRTPNASEFDSFSSNDLETGDAVMLAGRRAETGRGCLFIVEVPLRTGLLRANSRVLLQLELGEWLAHQRGAGGGAPHAFLVDTGSVGILVPRQTLGPN